MNALRYEPDCYENKETGDCLSLWSWNGDIWAESYKRRNYLGRRGIRHRAIQAWPKTYIQKDVFGQREKWSVLEHMPCGGNGRKSSWGQNVKDHQCSANRLGIYSAGNRDPAEVFNRAVKWVDLFFRNYFSGITVADELGVERKWCQDLQQQSPNWAPWHHFRHAEVEVPAGYLVQTTFTKLNIGESHLQPDKFQSNSCKTFLLHKRIYFTISEFL